MPFFQLRKARQDKALAIASGNPPKLTDRFSPETRVNLALALSDQLPAAVWSEYRYDDIHP